MNNLLPVWTGAMLVCVPVSLSFVFVGFVFRHAQGEKIEPGSAWADWLNTYVILAVCQTVVFAGIAGVAMLMGAFR